MSDLVRNPEDRFSHVMAHMMLLMWSDQHCWFTFNYNGLFSESRATDNEKTGAFKHSQVEVFLLLSR